VGVAEQVVKAPRLGVGAAGRCQVQGFGQAAAAAMVGGDGAHLVGGHPLRAGGEVLDGAGHRLPGEHRQGQGVGHGGQLPAQPQGPGLGGVAAVQPLRQEPGAGAQGQQRRGRSRGRLGEEVAGGEQPASGHPAPRRAEARGDGGRHRVPGLPRGQSGWEPAEGER